MVVGIISDTHGYFHPEIPDVFEDVDVILHAGDVGDISVLEGLQQLASVHAVWGNIDNSSLRQRVPRDQHLTLEGLETWMTHIGGRPGRWDRRVRSSLEEDPPDLFICGHSHILQIERIDAYGGMLFINPGAAGKHGPHTRTTCVRLRIEGGRARDADVIHLDSASS